MTTPYPLAAISEWLRTTLDPTRCDDYGPNGLQVEADDHERQITRIATGVTANLAFIDAAAALGADLAVVHHGIYWHGAPVTVAGPLGRRVRALIANRMSLVAYHLPLDGHPDLGNAPNLARALGLVDLAPAFVARGVPTGTIGRFPEPLPLAEVEALIAARVSPTSHFFRGGPAFVSTVGIVTGGAPRQASEAAQRGLDLYLTGEAGEYTQATALEERIHVAACGHHRSEVFGPRALATALAAAFPGVTATFVDVDNPV